MTERKGHISQILELLILALLVIVVRMIFEALLPLFNDWVGLSVYEGTMVVLRNYPLAVLMVVLDFLLVWALKRRYQYGIKPMLKTGLEFFGIAMISFVGAVMVQLSPGFKPAGTLNERLIVFFTISALINVVIVTLFEIYQYNRWKSNKALASEVKLRSQANYQYQLLKGQLNPHFLFNSLNVLDYLIHTDSDRASAYVKRLANVYRYQLNTENRTTVTVQEELDFVGQYTGLIKERFGDAVKIEITIDDKYMRWKMVPGSIQVMIENAVKHNVASVSTPLVVKIFPEGDSIVVTNRKRLKLNNDHPKGIGLKNIREQYKILFNSDIMVDDGNEYFTVKMPLYRLL